MYSLSPKCLPMMFVPFCKAVRKCHCFPGLAIEAGMVRQLSRAQGPQKNPLPVPKIFCLAGETALSAKAPNLSFLPQFSKPHNKLKDTHPGKKGLWMVDCKTWSQHGLLLWWWKFILQDKYSHYSEYVLINTSNSSIHANLLPSKFRKLLYMYNKITASPIY